MSNCGNLLTIDDVRMFIYDRTASDNELLGGLAFSDPEILAAMRFAAREYNSIPPISIQADPNSLPGDTNMFLDAVVTGLFIAKASQMKRNQVEYTAGGAAVALEKTQIAYMEDQIKFHRERYMQAMADHKYSINLRGFFARLS